MGSDHSVWSCTKPVDMLTRTYLNLEEDGLRVTFLYPVCPATGNRKEENHERHTRRLPGDSSGWSQDNRRMLNLTTYPLDPPPAWLHLLWEAFRTGAVAQHSSGSTPLLFYVSVIPLLGVNP